MSDELGDDIRNLLTAFHAADDDCAAGLIAGRIVVKMEPLLKAWTSRASSAFGDVMVSEEDFCVMAQAHLWNALCKHRHGARIENVFAYAKTICDHLLDAESRKSWRRQEAGSRELERLADQCCWIRQLHEREERRQRLITGWRALAQCPLNGRRAVLLPMPPEHVHVWVGLPDACPQFAAMLEINETDARRMWERLPLAEEEIARILGTSVGYVQKLRSLTKNKMWRLALQLYLEN